MGKKTYKVKELNKTKKSKRVKRNQKKELKKIIKLKKVKNEKRKFKEKKIVVSFKRLNTIIDEETIKNSSFEDLKIISSNFDINPIVNFKLLSILKQKSKEEYNKYISKYKYTLNYKDAKKLKCFSNDEKDILKELKSNYKDKIPEINSLSKIKLFSFLFYINNLECNFSHTENNYYKNITEKIKEKIISFSSEKDLNFKIPNNYGNYELQYYTYLNLFVNYFSEKLDQKRKNNENIDIKEIINESNELFFDWDKRSYGNKEIIDITEFELNKNKLKEFIQESIDKNKKKNKNGINVEKSNDKSNKINKNEEQRKYRKILCNFIDRNVKKLKKFEKEIYYLFKQEINDEKIIKNIEFIYYYLLFTKEGCELYNSYPNCLLNNPSIKNDKYIDRFYQFALINNKNSKESIKIGELTFYNLDSFFESKKDNPFCNRAKYFNYPTLLKKNIFQTNEDAYNNFKESLKNIYKSKLLEEIFYLTPEFNEFKYPLKDEEILNEMIENTIFLPYDQEELHGYTQKQFSKIYISTNIFQKEYSKEDISKIVVDIGFLFNTLIYEQFSNYLKVLLYYNSFRFREKKRLCKGSSEYKQNQFFIDNLSIIFSKYKNMIIKPIIDRGYMTEVYLYGIILYKLSFSEALKMHDKSTWNLSVLEHLKEFNKNNKAILKVHDENLDNILKNKNLSNFIKDIFIQFNKYYECNGIMKFDYSVLGDSEKLIEDLYFIEKGCFLFDYEVYLEKTKITIPDTGTF